MGGLDGGGETSALQKPAIPSSVGYIHIINGFKNDICHLCKILRVSVGPPLLC